MNARQTAIGSEEAVKYAELRIALWCVAPLALAVLISKAAELLYEYWVVEPKVTPGVFADWLLSFSLGRLLVTLLAFTVFGYLILRAVSSRLLRVALLVTFFFECAALLGMWTGIGRNPLNVLPPAQAWSELHFLGWVFRLDLSFLAFLFIVFAVAFLLTPRRNWRRVMLAATVISVLALTYQCLASAFFLKTHQIGSLGELLYLVHNFHAMAPAIAGELDWKIACVCLVMFGSTLLFVFGWRAVNRPGNKSRAERLRAVGWLTLGAVLLLAANVHPQSAYANIRYSAYTDDIGTSLLKQMLDSSIRDTRQQVADGVAKGKITLWSSKDLQFVPGPGARRLNVVIVMMESIRAKSVFVKDPTAEPMPFLRQLAPHSITLPHMYAIVPRTSASWVAVLYGAYPSANQVMRGWGEIEGTTPQFKSLPRLLAPHGYRSAFFTPGRLDLDNEGEIIATMGFEKVMSADDFKSAGAEQASPWGYGDVLLVDPIDRWVQKTQQAGQPFLLTVMTNIGHYRYNVPPSWKMRKFPGVPPGDLENYLNCLAYIDSFISDLYTVFRNRGLLDSTVFIFVGDHGDPVGEPFVGQGVRTVNDVNLHVPAVLDVAAAGLPAGPVNGTWQLIDLLPTIADILGFKMTGGHLPGRSILSPQQDERTMYYAGSIDHSYLGMLRGDRKFIYYFGRQPTQMFNLSTDPGETAPQSTDNRGSRLAAAEHEMLQWHEEVNQSLLQH